MKNFKKLFLLCITALVFAGACVTGPYNGADVPNYNSVVKFQGYLFTDGDIVILEARNKSTGLWENFAAATSGVQPGSNIAAGNVAGSDNPDLFYWSVDTSIATALNENSWCYWSDTCAFPGAGNHTAEIRFRWGSSELQTFEADGIPCLFAQISAGETFLDSATTCKSPTSPILTLNTNN